MAVFRKIRDLMKGDAVTSGGPRLALAAFGKHPAWDDHMEDLGLETEHLIGLKQFIYWDGCKSNLDSGAWTRGTAESGRLPGFDHAFLWRTGDLLTYGRMWSSSDGKNRTDYPMVVCASAERLGAGWLLQHAPGAIDRLHDALHATRDAGAVRALLEHERQELRSHVADFYDQPTTEPSDSLKELVASEPFRSQPELVVRLLYHIDRVCGGVGASGTASRRQAASGTHHFRVPRGAGGPAAWLRRWDAVVGQLLPAWPMFACGALQEAWLDIFTGVPGTADFFKLLVNESVEPLTTSIPYEIEEEFRRAALSRGGWD